MESILILLALVAIVWLTTQGKRRRARELAQAKQAYHASLGQLKQHPTDADLKERTLALGRVYSNLTRDEKGVTLFDEIALSNDINAACAGAGAAVHANKGTAVVSPEERLTKLADLKSKGLITEEEYQERRGRVLSEV
jgi:hypothetical protein